MLRYETSSALAARLIRLKPEALPAELGSASLARAKGGRCYCFAMTEHIRRSDDIEYEPHLHNGKADPGEVVWGWVPFEEDPSQGKDRPVVVIGERDEKLLTLMLTSKDHHRDAEHQAHEHRFWMDVGTGPWDHEGRPSEVRLNRLIILEPHAVRREGSVLPQEIFEKVLVAAEAYLD